MRLAAPDVPDLTVVDLPGIIRTSTAGQDPAVIAQVCILFSRSIIYQFMVVFDMVKGAGVQRFEIVFADIILVWILSMIITPQEGTRVVV